MNPETFTPSCTIASNTRWELTHRLRRALKNKKGSPFIRFLLIRFIDRAYENLIQLLEEGFDAEFCLNKVYTGAGSSIIYFFWMAYGEKKKGKEKKKEKKKKTENATVLLYILV